MASDTDTAPVTAANSRVRRTPTDGAKSARRPPLACGQFDNQIGVPCALHQPHHVNVHGGVELGTCH
jgi:hypothetical protein